MDVQKQDNVEHEGNQFYHSLGLDWSVNLLDFLCDSTDSCDLEQLQGAELAHYRAEGSTSNN